MGSLRNQKCIGNLTLFSPPPHYLKNAAQAFKMEVSQSYVFSKYFSQVDQNINQEWILSAVILMFLALAETIHQTAKAVILKGNDFLLFHVINFCSNRSEASIFCNFGSRKQIWTQEVEDHFLLILTVKMYSAEEKYFCHTKP